MRVGAWLFVSVMWATGTQVRAQTQAQAVSAEMASALRSLAMRADVIFAGQVLQVRRHEEAGYVEIQFRMDSAVRGCRTPGTYSLREWIGLWTDGMPRYAASQRLLMLLRAPGSSGLSAPVGGMAGRIPLIGVRTPPLLREHGLVPAENPGEQMDQAVDLRWVKALETRRAITAQPLVIISEPDNPRRSWIGPITPVRAEWVAPSANPSLTSVLAMLEGMHAL